MRRIITLTLALSLLVTSFASENSLILPQKKATEIMIPVGKKGQKISLMDLSQIKVKDYEALSGKKFNLLDKIRFKIAQRELKKDINPDGTFNSKRLELLNKKLAPKPAASEKSHHYLKLMLIFIIVAIVLAIIAIA